MFILFLNLNIFAEKTLELYIKYYCYNFTLMPHYKYN